MTTSVLNDSIGTIFIAPILGFSKKITPYTPVILDSAKFMKGSDTKLLIKIDVEFTESELFKYLKEKNFNIYLSYENEKMIEKEADFNVSVFEDDESLYLVYDLTPIIEIVTTIINGNYSLLPESTKRVIYMNNSREYQSILKGVLKLDLKEYHKLKESLEDLVDERLPENAEIFRGYNEELDSIH